MNASRAERGANKEVKACEVCGHDFARGYKKVKLTAKFCSNECKFASTRKSKPLSPPIISAHPCSWIKLPITGGSTIIDLGDMSIFDRYTWYVSERGYAVHRKRHPDGSYKTIRLHRLVNETPEGKMTDHKRAKGEKSADRLDNRKRKLRSVSSLVNSRSRDLGRGYCWDASKKKWMVRHNNKFYGRYDTEEEARRAVRLARSGQEYVPRTRKNRFLPRGVVKPNGSKRYMSKAQIDGVRYYLGTFDTAQEAEMAYSNITSEKSK